MKQLSKTMAMLCAAGLLTIAPPVSAQSPQDKSKNGTAPPGVKQKQETAAAKKPVVTLAGDGLKGGAPEDPADTLFEFHLRVRRTPGGINVLLTGTTPSANGAAAVAESIHEIRDHGMVGLLILPLVLETDPDVHRALRTAWSSVKAEASGVRLTLTASIPDKAVAAAADAIDATVRFAKGLVSQN